MKDFEEIYTTRPDKKEHGSSGYSNMKNLYDICLDMKPRLIVESGHWKGNSAWVFVHFAKVVSHDINMSNSLISHKNLIKVDQDISRYSYEMANNVLYYFDDHVSHIERLKYLISVDAKYAVFDDNQPDHICKKLKNPPSPTLGYLRKENHPIMDMVKHYEVMPFHGEGFDTRLTYIEL